MQVRHWISSGKDSFDPVDQHFDWAAASEYEPDDKKCGGQHERNTGVFQKGGDKTCNFLRSISEPIENTSCNSYTSGNSNNSGTGNSKSGK